MSRGFGAAVIFACSVVVVAVVKNAPGLPDGLPDVGRLFWQIGTLYLPPPPLLVSLGLDLSLIHI